MDDTDPAKLEAALEQLEIEKARRRQAKIDAGEMVSIQTVVVVAAADERRLRGRHCPGDSKAPRAG